ncbi:P2-related tail formation protein [Arthrobacter sp. B2I5]|uniref:phage minor head protein n=1 Tax=Arthrobacter sp. B2I5 TaxID=3042266 RepID=UPI00277F4410|nr:phage minor head protein [Arthrobacter sp. B2I5]MDQ0825414.1 P2-related tail formation protein [Arthrobacter sp. B2I5]
MATRAELLKAREELHVAIHASEEWQDGYKASPDTFRRLLELEASLETAVGEYLHELSDRAVKYVDWSRLPEPIKADAGPVANNDDPVWNQEQVLLTAATIELITELIATGAIAGEYLYGIHMGFSSLDDAIMQAARLYTAQMVKGITETTRKLIRESVAKSIALGEDAQKATARLRTVIDNPVRADLIAQTEPVNAYQTGLRHYASATGAKKKTWDGLRGACQLCTPLIGKTIDIDELFTTPNGAELDHPAAHPRCRCSLVYIY